MPFSLGRSGGQTRTSSDASVRARLAGWIVGAGVLSILVISITAIAVSSGGTNRDQTIRLVLAGVIPLAGTWVSTVLAFYFARENLAAATESALKVTGQVSASTSVKDVMLARANMGVKQLGASETDANVTIRELLQSMSVHKRIPILNQTGAALYVVHHSLILSYAQLEGVTPDGTFLDRTLADMRSKPELKKLSEALAFVSERDSVGEARDRMQAVPGSNDVFVTANGRQAEPVVGWLTNTDLASAN